MLLRQYATRFTTCPCLLSRTSLIRSGLMPEADVSGHIKFMSG